MANIDEYIKQIQQARYGEEVRDSIVNALKKVNDDNNSYVAIKKEVVAAKDIVEEKAEIFDEKANAAKETLTALQASTQIANEAKSSLNNIISSAISTKKELEQAVLETGEVIARVDNAKSNLDKSITSAGKAELNLQRQIETSNQIKNQLDVGNSTAIELKKNLDMAINEANTAKVKLVEAINNAGNTAVENIKTAQNTATQAVETAKTEAVKAVQTEGTTQTGAVTAEGEKQVQAVQTAAQEIIADREQIAKNKTDIAELRQKKADAIVENVRGTLLNVKDSSGAFFEDFSMSGKTTQDGTPTPDTPVPIVNAGESGNIEVKVVGKNILDVETATPKGWNLDITNLSNFEAGRTYTMTVVSLNDSSCGLFLDNHNKLVTYLNPGQSASFVMPDKSTFKKMSLCGGTATALLKDRSKVKIQIQLGNKSTAYEPYKEPQTLTLQLDRPLTKWDKLERREGIWGIARQGETKVLKATPEEKWAVWEDKQNAFFIMNDKVIKEGLCSHFEAKGSFEIGKETGIYLSETIHLIVTDMNIDSLENWKTWLQANPIAVAYKIAEETWEPLPEETQLALNALHTNYPTTVVTNSENVNMQLTYVADTKNYYLNREQTIQKQILDIQNALISQKISGGGIKVTNSAKLPIAKLSVFGKSEQVQTTGAQLLNYYKLAELSPQYYAIEQGELKAKGSNNAAWTSVPEYGTLAAGTYTISGNNVEIRDASKNTVIATCTGDIFSKFTLNEDTAIKMKVGYGLDKYPTIVKAMLNKGDSKKPYEPYTGGKPSPSVEYPQEITSCGDKGTINLEITGDNAELQTLTIPTPNGLLGLKVDLGGNYTDSTGQQWICDEIDLARGKYVQRIAERIFDGTEAWEKYKENQYSLPKWADKKDKMIAYTENKYYLCNIARIKNKDSMAIGEFSTHLLNQGNGWILFGFAGTLEEWKRYLATKKAEGNPVTVQYILAEPVEYNLPPETIAAFKKLHTNYPTTLVSNNADAGMELTYTVDTQSYIDGKITEVSTAIVQKGI